MILLNLFSKLFDVVIQQSIELRDIGIHPIQLPSPHRIGGHFQKIGSRMCGYGNIGSRKQGSCIRNHSRERFRNQKAEGQLDKGFKKRIYLGRRKQKGWIWEYSRDIFRKKEVGRMDRGIQQGYIQEAESRKDGQGNTAWIYLGSRKQEGWIGEYNRDIFRKKEVGRMDRGIQQGYIQEEGSRKDGWGNIARIYLGRRKQEGWIGEYRRDIFRKQEVGRMDRGVQQGYILEEGSRKDGQGNTAGIYLGSITSRMN